MRSIALGAFCCTLLIGSIFGGRPAGAQSLFSSADVVPDQLRDKLLKRYNLDLRDSTLLDALFTIRDVCGINIVAGNEVTGTVNASFEDTRVCDILDSLLITRGYGYRVVGTSLAVVPLDRVGDQLPLFRTEIISLVENQAEDLLPSIDSLLSPEGRAHAIASSNSMLIIDYPIRIEQIQTHVKALEAAAKAFQSREQARLNPSNTADPELAAVATNEVKVFRTQYVDPATLAEAVNALLSEQGRIAPIEMENKLIVSDLPENVARVAAAVQQLDQPRPQVRIWAMIYDCSTEDLDRLGINWNSSIAGTAVDAVTGVASQSAVLSTVTSPLATGNNGMLTITSLNDQVDLEGVIQALRTADDSRLLADPNVVVMNHETAEIEIVTEVPYQQLTQGIDGGTIGTTEFREAGVTLNVIPHIADDGTIAMVVNPRFSLLTGYSETDNAPIIDRRETNTTVRVADGQTIVLGGLRQRTRISEQTAVPVLGTIPGIGKLFKHRSASTRESELLVFITPQIVGNHCIGSQREYCVEQFLSNQVRQTPTDPVPFGIETVRAEQQSCGHHDSTVVQWGHMMLSKDTYSTNPNWTRQHPPQAIPMVEPELIETDAMELAPMNTSKN
ncbi:secretin N-terminal domain-containing protein [Roseiconus lacunae]|uniref:type II secretion system protein GspD n=1 Tax=Roseiconus lacunae TaxID=2605694 RepID=UPI00308A2D74|nr:secretin N-terminal domain-containing protein [Stieleria sp. HD01]